MKDDPIVEEVRNAGDLLAKQSEYDFHKYIELLRKHEKESKWPKASPEELQRIKQSHVIS